ncbi:hypothetical protein [Zunongwangia atlantica]|uniref:Uncharacterized protein n=1 Tax=Zunongwangia atlantica 22II14-10F7 TaxID=1185767 RepID=A0A1Y1T7D8_9FLAO|nr:hypothetical protein [Zunongwangia atlantica]ORL46977.1 hypothetical protein IIF7_03126 [Zunongwangia atlantica 22II14-10F7]
MKIKHFCILFYFVFTGVYSQESRKDWKEGDLTWADFKELEISFENSISELKYVIGYTPSKEKVNDTVFFRLQSFCFIDTQLSWVNPKFKTPENLQYNQVIFNIAELYRRKLQYDLDHLGSYFSAETVFQNQYEALNNEVEIFQSQSRNGRDHEIVQEWVANIADRLAIYENNTIPKYEKANFGMGMHVGAAYSFRNESIKEHFDNSIGFNFGFDFSYKSSILYINMIISGGNVDQAYSGRTYWEEDLDYTLALLDFSYGYAIVDNPKLKIAPFAGLAITEFSEDDYDGDESDLIITDYNFLFGVNLDYKIRKRVNMVPSVFLSKREITETAIRSRLFVSRNDFHDDLSGYSINLSLGISWYFRLLK